ncbi:trans-sialidase, putative, partial [Trypanosoma cruzi marinkellei]
MLVGKHSHEDSANCGAKTARINPGILLVKGNVSVEGAGKKIHWNYTDGLPCIIGVQHNSLTQLIVGGGSGVRLRDGTFLFPVEATNKKEKMEKDVKSASLIIHNSADNPSWNLSKGMSADGCSDPSVVEWKEKVMMMTACDDGRRRVYEIGDKGESWTEALGTLSRVWGNKKGGNAKTVRSGFITATFDCVGEKRNVMLITLPVYSNKEEGNEKDELHLWLTDNTHIVDIGPVSGKDDDAAASSLLYKIAKSETNEKKEDKLIALYEMKTSGADKPSPGMVSVLLKKELERVKEVLSTWKEVDERVSQLCPPSSATVSKSTGTACSAVNITDGLVGFLSGNFSDEKWKDEYLGVNATVKGVAEMTDNGLKFEGVWAEWPVGSQGENQLYHFANYNFTLVATVSIHGVPKERNPIPLIGVKMNDGDSNPVLLGLSYNKEKQWQVSCGDQATEKHSSTWEPETRHQVAIVLQNSSQGSVYVDGKRVWNGPCALEITDLRNISHFYIGGDGGSKDNTGRKEVS